MTYGSRWTRDQLLVAFGLYCRLPFGQFNRVNPEVIKYADAIGRTPSALAIRLGNIASLDPEITSTGRVGMRSTSADLRAMWDEMHADWKEFAIESERALREAEGTLDTHIDIDQGRYDGRVGLDREVSSTVRLGQDFFRAALLSAYNARCCITRLSIPSLLVASHIVPWSHDRTNRVNPRNGLLLSALHDRAFDNGLITIDDDMTVRISNSIGDLGDEFFLNAVVAYEGKPIHTPDKFTPSRDFLAYHRDHIFQG